MSVTVIMAVAVLESPKFRLPSMSVACTMIVYWDTFCKKSEKNRLCSYLSAKSFLFLQSTAKATELAPRGKKKLSLCSLL